MRSRDEAGALLYREVRLLVLLVWVLGLHEASVKGRCAVAKKKAKVKAKEVKETIRPDSPRRLLNGMSDKIESCRNSLQDAITATDDGMLDDARVAVGEAQRAYERIGAGAFDEVAAQLQVAENEIAEVLLRVNR